MVVCLAMLLGASRASNGQPATFPQPLSPRIANYDIAVTLDDVAKRITGEMILTWTNPSDDSIDDLQFHLYTNAFKNAGSSFLREMLHDRAAGTDGEAPGRLPWEKDDGWGWLRVTRMSVDDVDVSDRMAFFQPDDANTDDETVLRVPLLRPVAPRATIRIEMSFVAKIPRCHRRTGWWLDDFFMMAHWFPKIGVYEAPGTRFVPADAPHGRWNCHQFHAATEFYADYGVYDVRITLPQGYVVGTTGLIVDQRNNGNGTQTVVAHAEDVHDFAWVADAQFRVETITWHSPITDQEVAVRLLYQPGHESVVDKYLRSVVDTLNHVDLWLGPGAYPYPNITVVDPRYGSDAGGMEYPTLITGGASWAAEFLLGDGLRLVETVTIHEFMHQIWYGIVGNNEFEEAWLDEGLTTYSEARIAADLFGRRTSAASLYGLSLDVAAAGTVGYTSSRSRNDAALEDRTFGHWHSGVGRNLAYNKAATMLHTLENYLGRRRFDQIMRTYFERWKFRHPTRADFIAVANETSGEDLAWFFNQIVASTGSLDYAVASIANVPIEDFEKGVPAGDEAAPSAAANRETELVEAGHTEDSEEIHESTVVFRRVGEVVFPMEVLIEFSDGNIIRDRWDGHARVKTFRFTRRARVVRAAIDPSGLVPLDVNRLNNSLRVEPDPHITDKYTLKGFFWLQSLLQFVSMLG